jgi:D-glycero-alpha-D-manno-heptose-7-phosphate kinase
VEVAAEARLVRRAAGYRFAAPEGAPLAAATAAELASAAESALAGVVIEHLGLGPVAVELASESPRGGGLGASSALAVALIAAAEALEGRPPSPPARRAALARDLEARLMGLPTGTQDHYAALLGGALEIRHQPGGEEVLPIAADLAALGESLMVVYSGRSHFSAAANWQIVRRRLDGEAEMRSLLGGIAEVAADLAAALAAGDLPRVGELMSREWSLRRRLSAEVSTPGLESLLALAASLGAWGGKACGAGGGGCLALLCPPARREEIARRLTEAGGQVVPARPTARRLEVELPGAPG